MGGFPEPHIFEQSSCHVRFEQKFPKQTLPIEKEQNLFWKNDDGLDCGAEITWLFLCDMTISNNILTKEGTGCVAKYVGTIKLNCKDGTCEEKRGVCGEIEKAFNPRNPIEFREVVRELNLKATRKKENLHGLPENYFK